MSKYPLTTNHFIVEWGGTRMGFSEVSGIVIEHSAIEHREGSSPDDSPVIMPGHEKYNYLTLKRGIIQGDNEFYQWINTVKFNKAERRDMTITLLNESHEPVLRWKVRNAWPFKLIGPVLNANASEVAVETLQIAHEGISVDTF